MSLESYKVGDIISRPPLPKSEQEITAHWQGDLSIPLVSIICYTYNHVNYIKDALNSFLMQRTSFPFEIIIHDDCSNDGTTEIIEEYFKQYPNIIVPILQSENQWSQGVMPRNFTYPKVRGKYLAICEGDDYWIQSNKLSKQVESFAPGISLVFHNAVRVKDGLIIDTSYYPEKNKPLEGYNSYQMVRGTRIPTASALMLSKPILNISHLPNIINGDHFLWAILASEGKAKFINEPWSIYRHHTGGVWSNRKTLDKIEPALKSRKTIFNYMPPEFKASALLGYILIGKELVNVLAEEGEILEASTLTSRLIIEFYKMSIACSFRRRSNLIEYLKAKKTLLSIPKLIIKSRFK